ncbi:spermatogenesis-associated protein 22 [Plakobranchus ocellatus]|uniref:Spermatogenesis-associated protein 22 n=1 Tax=Plakobranchus ocellatus TaxID=259542 RepID=A0AAV4C3Z1_9GAST|nr:spermatogenesis-associated protein 22 [Plakobranchus ocellatus]
MNRLTPVPLFNYRKRQRQALVSDPGQILTGTNPLTDQPCSSHGQINQRTNIKSEDSFSASSPTLSNKNGSSSSNLKSNMGFSSVKGPNTFSSSRVTPGLMDMSGKFPGMNKSKNLSVSHQSHSNFQRKSSSCNTMSSFDHDKTPTCGNFKNSFETRTAISQSGFAQGWTAFSRGGSVSSTWGSRGGGSYNTNRQSSDHQPRASNTNTGLTRQSSTNNQQKLLQLPSKSSFASGRSDSSSSSNVISSNKLLSKQPPLSNVMINANRNRAQQSTFQGKQTQFSSRTEGARRTPYSNASIDEQSIFDKQKMISQTQTDKKDEKPTPDTSLRIFTCPIASIKSWVEFKVTTFPVMFEVYGVLDSATVKDLTRTGKEFVLRDDTDSIKCIFYEIDRDLPRLTRGQVHRVVGSFDNRHRVLKVVSVRPAQKEERSVCQAASALSQAEMERHAGLSNEQ